MCERMPTKFHLCHPQRRTALQFLNPGAACDDRPVTRPASMTAFCHIPDCIGTQAEFLQAMYMYQITINGFSSALIFIRTLLADGLKK